MNDLLNKNNIFNDPKTGFIGAEKVLRRSKLINPNITMKQVKAFLNDNPINQVFQKPSKSNVMPRIHRNIGHYQADLTFLTRYKRQNNNYHILLAVINVNTKYAYVEALKDKTQKAVYDAFKTIRKQALNDGRTINVLQSDNGKEFQNSSITEWAEKHLIEHVFCERDDKKCLGVAERFNRTIKLMIEKYLTKMDSNRWIDHLQDFVENYNSSYHSTIRNYPDQLEIFDEVDLIRKSIEHNLRINNSGYQKGDFVRLLNKRGTFEKEGQRFTTKIYLVEEVGLHSVRVQGKENKYNFYEILKVSPKSQAISDTLRQQQLHMFKVDKRLREREGIEPNRNKRQKRTY